MASSSSSLKGTWASWLSGMAMRVWPSFWSAVISRFRADLLSGSSPLSGRSSKSWSGIEHRGEAEEGEESHHIGDGGEGQAAGQGRADSHGIVDYRSLRGRGVLYHLDAAPCRVC